MKKKLYEKPSSKVIELKHRQQLLVGSAPNQASFEDYEEDNTFSW